MDEPVDQTTPAPPPRKRWGRQIAAIGASVAVAAAATFAVTHNRTNRHRPTPVTAKAQPKVITQGSMSLTIYPDRELECADPTLGNPLYWDCRSLFTRFAESNASKPPARIQKAIRKKLEELKRKGIDLGSPNGNAIDATGRYVQSYTKGLLEINPRDAKAIAITGKYAQLFRWESDLFPNDDLDMDKTLAEARAADRDPVVVWADGPKGKPWCTGLWIGDLNPHSGLRVGASFYGDTGKSLPPDLTPHELRSALACRTALNAYEDQYPGISRGEILPASR